LRRNNILLNGVFVLSKAHARGAKVAALNNNAR